MDMPDREHLETMARHYRRLAHTEHVPAVAKVLTKLAEEYEMAAQASANGQTSRGPAVSRAFTLSSIRLRREPPAP